MSCAKRRHPTQWQAENALHKAWRLNRSAGKLPTRAYQCPFCDHWHLTSQPRRISQ